MKFFTGFVLIATIFFTNGCKSSKGFSQSAWNDKNLKCAAFTINDFQKRINSKIKEIRKYSAKLEASLLKYNCPVAKHSGCISYGAVQASATYISAGISKYGISLTGKMKATSSPSLSQEGRQDEKQLEDIVNKLKKRKKQNPEKQTVKSEQKSLLNSTKPQSEQDLSPAQIARESGCGFTVKSKECSFLSVDRVLNSLAIMTEQCAALEQDVSSFLKAAGVKENLNEISKIHKNVRLLERMIARLVIRENLIPSKPQQAKILQMMQAPEIKGVVIDFTKSVPLEIIQNLKIYLKKLNKTQKLFNKLKKEYAEKLNASTRYFGKIKKSHAEKCLKKKNCWDFRICVENYRLPGIFVKKPRKIYKKPIID